MSMHTIALTDDEQEGLRTHGLPVGTPSQLSDAFRLGMKWASRNRGSVADLPGGWRLWLGGECPVGPGVRVDVRYRSGDVGVNWLGRIFRWHHESNSFDIVAYRIVGEPK